MSTGEDIRRIREGGWRKLKIKLTETEKARMARDDEASKFANEIIEQCRQKNFTVRQFNHILGILDFKRQLLESHAADIVKMND